MTQTTMQTAATALRTISELAPFCPFVHTKGKGGMRLEPDRFHTWNLAVPGGVYRAGSSRGVFAAQADKAGNPAHFVRNGGGYHAGGQRVEPVADTSYKPRVCQIINRRNQHTQHGRQGQMQNDTPYGSFSQEVIIVGF